MNEMDQNDDKGCVIITGAGRGMGFLYALRFAELGYQIIALDRNLSGMMDYEVEAQLLGGRSYQDALSQYGRSPMLIELDATDDEACQDVLSEVDSRGTHIAAVVANAGGGGQLNAQLATDISWTDVNEILQSNLRTTMNIAGPAAVRMKSQATPGRIVTISSVAGISVYNNGELSDYAIAKAGVLTYTRYLAAEMAPYGVPVNAVAPGYTSTGQFQQKAIDQAGSEELLAETIPMGRLSQPTDVLSVVEWLATEASPLLTGQVFTVDGGLVKGAR